MKSCTRSLSVETWSRSIMPSHVSAEEFSAVNIDRFETDDDRAVPVDWSSYAKAYDLLSEHNPAYQALLRDFEGFLSTIRPPELIYDIGGGTGNYTKIAAHACPCSEIRFVEPNAGMIGLARAKLAAHGISLTTPLRWKTSMPTARQ